MEQFSALNKDEKARVLINFCHQITIFLREFFFEPDKTKDRVQLAQELNELLHRALGYTGSFLTTNGDPKDEQSFLNMIFGNVANQRLDNIVHQTWDRAMSAVKSRRRSG